MSDTAPYARLAGIYDSFWGRFVTDYTPFLERLFRVWGYTPRSVLDLGCGTGGLLRSMAHHAEQLVGIDNSPQMLEMARKTSAELPTITFQEGDFLSIDIPQQFDLVLCTYDAINYCRTTDELCRLLVGVEKHLTDRGRFVFDFVNEKHFRRTSGTTGDFELSGVKYRFANSYDLGSRESVTTFDFGDCVERHIQVPIEYVDLVTLVAKCTLQLEHAYSDLRGSPLDDKTGRIIAVVKHVSEVPHA
jgi:SAM-dependent methyltransferase